MEKKSAFKTFITKVGEVIVIAESFAEANSKIQTLLYDKEKGNKEMQQLVSHYVEKGETWLYRSLEKIEWVIE